MVTICKRYDFDAAHSLSGLAPGHKCARLHGHTYVCEVRVRGDVNSVGMVIDYADLDKVMSPVLLALDHRHLNEDLPEVGNPTTEALAVWIHGKVRAGLPLEMYVGVRLYESSLTWAEVGWP